MTIKDYKTVFLEYLDKKVRVKEPTNLYQPILYILNLSGKRLRPALTLLSCDLFGGAHKEALDAALALEMFHNFSLIHDDIMDDAPLRRSQETVHKKWDLNTGILSGDALLVLSYQVLESYPDATYKKLMRLFNKTALQVCEGQQFDFDFEMRTNVSVAEYMKMIRLKTAVLVAASLQFGGLIAGAAQNDLAHIYEYGLHLGIAFQLQDDYLDVFGDADFGKQKAGDIIENKKTFLYLRTLELAEENDKKVLLLLYQSTHFSTDKIARVIRYFKKYQVVGEVEQEIAKHTLKALDHIYELSISKERKELLKNFANDLMKRNS